MRKIVYLSILILSVFLGSCSSDKPSNEPCSVMVNVKYSGSLASPSFVRLYDYDKAKDFNKEIECIIQYGDHQNLIDADGNTIAPAYTSYDYVGVNIFDEVQQGKYIVIAFYKPSGFTYPNFYFYGYKEIVVSEATDATLYVFDFTSSSERGKFLQF